MSWKQRLFKPKWQHKNADIRLESVSSEQQPELINSLVEIAATDEDSRVRCAAIKRLHQLGNILKLYDSETDPEVKSLLAGRIHQLASSTNDSRPAPELRMQVIQLSSDRTLIEHLASHAPEAELRRAALAKVTRQGVLGDCCIADSDADNRHFAASKITQHTTIKRVISALRTRDKTLHAQLRQRLHQELIQRDDPDAIQAEAINICSSLERCGLENHAKESTEIDAMHTAWQAIASRASSEMSDRYQRICERLATPAVVDLPSDTANRVIRKPAPAPEEDSITETAEAPLANEALARIATDICLYELENQQAPQLNRVKRLKQQLEKAWTDCKPPHADDQVAWGEAHDIIQKLESDIEQRQLQY